MENLRPFGSNNDTQYIDILFIESLRLAGGHKRTMLCILALFHQPADRGRSSWSASTIILVLDCSMSHFFLFSNVVEIVRAGRGGVQRRHLMCVLVFWSWCGIEGGAGAFVVPRCGCVSCHPGRWSFPAADWPLPSILHTCFFPSRVPFLVLPLVPSVPICRHIVDAVDWSILIAQLLGSGFGGGGRLLIPSPPVSPFFSFFFCSARPVLR